MPQPLKRDIQQVWTEYAQTKSEGARNTLMENYLPIVRYTAERIHAKLPREVDVDDLMSVGAFGLMHAIAGFDPARGVKFETYCAGRIRGAILDELRSLDPVSRLARSRSHKLTNATMELQVELGRSPSDDELARKLDVSMGDLKKLVSDSASARILSLSANRTPEDSNGNEFRDTEILEDRTSRTALEDAQRRDLKAIITQNLSRAERLIVTLYYYDEMTMKEIGAVLDLSESRVSQMHTAIIQRLQMQVLGKSTTKSGSAMRAAAA